MVEVGLLHVPLRVDLPAILPANATQEHTKECTAAALPCFVSLGTYFQ